MNRVFLNLLVVRSIDMDRMRVFYELIGLVFERHRHGNGEEHFAAELPGGMVFEIYPVREGDCPTTSLRIGFRVADCDGTVGRIEAAGHKVHSRPADSPWGRRAVVADPDGHKVEIVQAHSLV